MADPAHASQTPGLTIRSLRGDAFTLPATQVLSRSDFHFAPPRSLRLPIAPMSPPVLQVGLLTSPPQVNSFSFPRSSVPAAQVPRRPRPAPEAVSPETPAAAAEPATQAIQAYAKAKAVMPGPVTLTADNIELDAAWNLVERALQLEIYPRLTIHYTTCYTPATRFYLSVAPPLEALLATRVHLQVAPVPEADLPNQFTVPCGKAACSCGAFTLVANAVARARLCLAVQVALSYGVGPRPAPPENWWPERVGCTRPARSRSLSMKPFFLSSYEKCMIFLLKTIIFL
jgi:hypothetical protein